MSETMENFGLLPPTGSETDNYTVSTELRCWGLNAGIEVTGPDCRWRVGLGRTGDTEAGRQSAGDHQTICIEAELWFAPSDGF